MTSGGSHQAVILTAIPVEYEAVRAHLTDIREEVHPVGTVYERGTFSAYGQQWNVGIVEIGAGNPGAAVEAERAINYFNPSLILFIGIAGGLRDVKYGDVVVATKVYGYESGRANVTFQTRPYIGNPAYSLEQRARAEAKKKDWLERLGSSIPDPPPRVFVKPLAAGESVVTSRDSETWKLLASSYSDALAVEMEGHGFFQAVHAYPHIDALIIRGISDLIDDKSEADANNLQAVAARHASAFAFEVLAKLGAVSFKRRTSRRPKVSTARKKHEPAGFDKSPDETSLESETLPDASMSHILDFLDELRKCLNEISDIRHFFGEGRVTYPDQFIYAIRSLNRLNTVVNEYVIHVANSRSIKLKIDNIKYRTDDLISTIRDFPHIRVSMQQDHQSISYQKQTREKLDSLLEQLTQLVAEVSGMQH